jgi:hypothetical protein
MRSQLAPTYAWVFVVGIVSFIASFVVLGTASLRDPRLSLGMIFQGKEIDATELTKPLPSSDTNSIVVEPPIWSEQLAPRGMETRLGDALRTLLARRSHKMQPFPFFRLAWEATNCR